MNEELDNSALETLDKCEYAFLSTLNADGSPYCVPISPVRERAAVYFHGSKRGIKRGNILNDPRACLTCAINCKTRPDALSVDYQSCLINGRVYEVSDGAERVRALRLLCDKYAPLSPRAFADALDRDLERTGVYKLVIDSAFYKSRFHG